MTVRQTILKKTYPLFMWVSKFFKQRSAIVKGTAIPKKSFYSLNNTLNNGEKLNFENLRGKKVLLVNTASDCGYTNQYADLQQLAAEYKDQLIVLGFPANDFKEQEKGTDEEIASFCKKHYGVTFPLMRKSSVIKSQAQNPVYQWLTDKAKNGWNDRPPSWNFTKYLVNEKGELTYYFGPSISPLHPALINLIKNQNHV